MSTASTKFVSATRSVAALLLGILAVAGLVVGSVALWGRSTLFDSDRVASVTTDALEAPGATEALSTYLTEQLLQVVALDDRLETLLPDSVEPLGAAIAERTESFVRTRLDSALRTPDVQSLLVGVVRHAHTQLLELLDSEGLGGGFDVSADTVTFNLLPLVTVGLDKISDVGILGALDVPQFTTDGDPAEQISVLETRLGRDLPDNFGQLVVYEGDVVSSGSRALQTAQDVTVLAKRATPIMVVLTVVCFGLSLLLARRRRRAAATLGLAVAATMLVARLALGRVVDEVPDLVTNPGASAALDTAVRNLTGGLMQLVTTLIVVGTVVAGLTFLTRRRQPS